MDDRLSYRPIEAARAIGVGRTAIYELVRAKKIPFFRPNGKSIRIPVTALHEWISQQTAAANSASSPPKNPVGKKASPAARRPAKAAPSHRKSKSIA